jgi:hypothetical protein
MAAPLCRSSVGVISRVDPRIAAELARCPLPWSLQQAKRHLLVRIEGRVVTKLPFGQAFRDAGKSEWEAMKTDLGSEPNREDARGGRRVGSDFKTLPDVATLKRLVGSGLTSEAMEAEIGLPVTRLRTALTRAGLRKRIYAIDPEACVRLRQAGYAPVQTGMRIGLLPAQVERILAEASAPA